MVNNKILSHFKDDPPTEWSDAGRRIGAGLLYPVEEIIRLLSNSDVIRASTEKCRNDIQALELDNEELARLIKNAVTGGRYRKSVWCRLSAKAIAACDDYVVIDKTWVEAAHKEIDCEIYLKFAINSNGKLLLMVSCHLST
ncbi:MAG: hypothetical protein HLUCCO02_04040 [Idiomarinaceae bacterium HL-53]|nr:MAG: hypothetical protein HLUCCO02_04040 [Idiomarinaceae bacterium HL-53]CUS49187.1 hypothetical protein Ga0003345_2174 [Idiomarinaceae bacterium HL-53]